MRNLSMVLLSGLAAVAIGPARAADFYPDSYPPSYDAPPPAPYNQPYAPPPAYEPRYNGSGYNGGGYNGGYYPPPPRVGAAEECRTYTKPRIDEWGRQVLRRVKVCEEVVGATPPYPPSPYGAPPPHAAAPAGVYWNGSDYRAPRPPLDVGVRYDPYR